MEESYSLPQDSCEIALFDSEEQDNTVYIALVNGLCYSTDFFRVSDVEDADHPYSLQAERGAMIQYDSLWDMLASQTFWFQHYTEALRKAEDGFVFRDDIF